MRRPPARLLDSRTVMKEPACFERLACFVALVGVLPGGRAEGDLILARALGPRVEATGVAQGMSGSPVYVDGKLIGALSSGWAFSKEPVFGITPIGEMLAVLDQPESPATSKRPGPW